MMLNFSTSTSSTSGVMNAGRLGPEPDVLDAQVEQGQQDGHRLLLVPGQDHRQRQVVHPALEGVGQRHGDLDGRVGVVALADVQQPRDAADVAEVQLVEDGTCRRPASGSRSPWAPSRRTRCSSCGPAWRRRSRRPGRSAGSRLLLTASMTLSATPSTALRPKPTMIVLAGSSSAKPGSGQGLVDDRREVAVRSMCVTPGQATRPAGEDAVLVGFLRLLDAVGGHQDGAGEGVELLAPGPARRLP